MGIEQDLEQLFGLTSVAYKANLSKEELFHAAIANDRGRIRKDGPDDEQKAYATCLGVDGPLIYYTDPTCTGRPVKDTFAVAHPELEDRSGGRMTFSASIRRSSRRSSNGSLRT